MTYRKKLIEVALPLEAINAASAKEKSIRHGHPSTLHLWWARRPLAACRAVLFGQLVDDPSAWPDRFPTEEAQEKERQRLFRVIEHLVRWENSTNEGVLNAARREIARSIAWNRGDVPPTEPAAVQAYLQQYAPPAYDPFSGGGSIPLEAQRLGLRAQGSDLNPVAVLIGKALVEIPPKFAGCPPVNPKSRAELARGGRWHGRGAQGLAEDVRHYGQWMRDEAFKRIGHLYPQVDLPAEQGGGKAAVIAWIWARTVASPNPAARGAHVPLASTFLLSTKEGRKAWVEPVVDTAAMTYNFAVRSGRPSEEQEMRAKAGTKASRGANFVCLLTGTAITGDYIKQEGRAGRMGTRLMALVAEGTRGRIYVPPTEEMERIAAAAEPTWAPEQELPKNPRWFSPPDYGMPTYGDLFTPRQLVALTTFSDLVAEARDRALADALAAGLSPGQPRLADGGTGADAYADAVAVYLAFALDKAADRNTTLCAWESGMGRMRNTFGRQAIPMVWDYVETNPLAGAGGDIAGTAFSIYEVLSAIQHLGAGTVGQSNAIDAVLANKVVSTDPPYYDNIGYADLSDFFYVWLRRSLASVYPSLFSTMLVPKAEELVATPYRHGGKDKAEQFFMEGMSKALANMTAADAGYPVTIYYAFKQSEKETDGVSSTGWATFLEAVVKAGWSIDGTWPMRTELGNRMIGSGTNALASSIVMVCRKRPADAPITTRAAFLNALRRELPAALKLLQHGNIAPVDMAQASIGPGMAIFTRHAKVLESDDSPMTVRTALQLVNAALDEYLSEQESEYDADTRFAITWFESHGMDAGPYGAAELLATARGIAVQGVVQAGILEAKAGKARLLRRDELPEGWDPAADPRICVWECTQHLIRRLQTAGVPAAAGLYLRLGEHGEVARDLAYRLYQVCERRKWAEEALAYNSLVVEWPEILKAAAETAPAAPAQMALGV